MSWKRNSWTEQRCFRLLPGFTYLLLVLLTCVASTEDSSAPGAEHVWAVKVQSERGGEGSQEELAAVADSTATDLGLVNRGRIEPFPNIFLFELNAGSRIGRSPAHTLLRQHPAVVWTSKQRPLKRVKRDVKFSDPYFSKQWHLVNRHEVGHDINVTGVWSDHITGRGVVIAVVDDGLEHTNQDITQNYNPLGSYDFNDNDRDPMPNLKTKLDNTHGTKCAGLIAAVANEVCAVGVAYGAQVSGIRMLDGTVTDILEGKSFIHKAHTNWIFSCSWGPDDKGKTVEGPGFVAQEALQLAVSRGRFGYGNVFVFASGNGGSMQDNCNYDGYANSVYTITVGAVDEQNNMPYYAELCPSMLAVTYSNGNKYGDRSIVTTDASIHKGCTTSFSGTSAAAPIASGMIALVLQVRPCLGWRDVQALLVYTARKVDVEGAQWVRNAAGFEHSDQHGYGLMDTYRLTRAAAVWPLLSDVQVWSSPSHTPNSPITGTVQLTTEVGVTDIPSDLRTLEYVEVTVTVDHLCRGALEFVLTSPHNTQSTLATTRKYDKTADGLDNWTFTTVKFWGETPPGTWTLSVIDHPNKVCDRPHSGVVREWMLRLRGSNVSQQDIGRRRRLVEAAVSNTTGWSPLPCPPLPSYPQELSLPNTELSSMPMVITVHVTTPTNPTVITVNVTTPILCNTTTPPLRCMWQKIAMIVGVVLVGVVCVHCISDVLCHYWRRYRATIATVPPVKFTRNARRDRPYHEDDDTEMVHLLREDREGRVEVLGDGGRSRREDDSVLYKEVALPSDEQEDNAPLLVHTLEMSSITSDEWCCEQQQDSGLTGTPDHDKSAQELADSNHQVEVDPCHSPHELGSTKNRSPPTSGIHCNYNGTASSIHSNSSGLPLTSI